MKLPLQLAILTLGAAIASSPGRAQEIRRAEPPARSAQQPPVTSSSYSAGLAAMERSSMSAVPVDPNKRLAVGDGVSVEIVEDREPPTLKRVTATGDIDLSPLGRIRVAGKTANEVEASLKAYLEKDYYYVATVRVALDSVNYTAIMMKISIAGEVRAPGPLEIPAGDKITLTEAILRAGNFTQWAKGEQVKLFRHDRLVGTYNVPAILKEGRISEDPVLQDGDRVNVEKSWFKLKN
jgi:protein involved in polysaccharide export with SLBB domain